MAAFVRGVFALWAEHALACTGLVECLEDAACSQREHGKNCGSELMTVVTSAGIRIVTLTRVIIHRFILCS